jgi:hypothetical protein
MPRDDEHQRRNVTRAQTEPCASGAWLSSNSRNSQNRGTVRLWGKMTIVVWSLQV